MSFRQETEGGLGDGCQNTRRSSALEWLELFCLVTEFFSIYCAF